VDLKGFTYRVEANLVLTKDEVDYLLELSGHHYDGYCRSVGQRGGFLYGWRNAIVEFGARLVTANITQADTICKILELDTISPLNDAFRDLMERLSNEASRVNA
jgi:hypothetical protein